MRKGQPDFGELDRFRARKVVPAAREKAADTEELAIIGHQSVIKLDKVIAKVTGDASFPGREEVLRNLSALKTFAQGVSGNSDQVASNTRRLLERILEDAGESL